MPVVSSDEKEYIIRGCEQNIRADGRGNEDFRTIVVDSNIFPQVNGSSRVRIGDSIDVLCSIKLEVTETSVDRPNEGDIDVDVEVSPVCRIGEDNFFIDEAQVAEAIEKSLKSYPVFPLSQLCIVPGRFCWTIYVDLLVLQLNEDVTTACSLATYVALNNTQVPRTMPKVGDDFDVDGDVSTASFLTGALDLPILLPVCKIGQALVLDATRSERDCASSQLLLVLNRTGSIAGLQLQALEKAVQVQDIARCIEKATDASRAIFAYLTSYCQAQQQSALDDLFPYLAITSPGLKV